MKPADTLQERTDMNRNTMKRAITAVLAVIMVFFAISIGGASAGDSEPLFYAETTKETRVREKASKTSALVATVQAGTEVSVLEEVKGKDGKIWYRIQMEDGTVGYARNDFFRKTEKASGNNTNTEATTAATWKDAYHQFVTSGTYNDSLHSVMPEFEESFKTRDMEMTYFALHDMDLDGVPELLVETLYTLEQCDVFTFDNGSVKWLGSMAGENFIDAFFYFNDLDYIGLFVSEGGPAVSVDLYTIQSGKLKKTYIGRTKVEKKDGYFDTTGFDMSLQDEKLYRYLSGFVMEEPQKYGSYLNTMPIKELRNDSKWPDFYASATVQTNSLQGKDAKEDQKTESSKLAGEDWKEAYYQYLTGDGFQHQKGSKSEKGWTYWTDCFGNEYVMDAEDVDGVLFPVGFALYDWDQDGVPELFSYDGSSHKEGSYYAYTYRNGQMTFIGKVGKGWSCGIVPYRDEEYNVLFSEVIDGYYMGAEYASLDSNGKADLQVLFDGQVYDKGDDVPEVWELHEGPTDQKLYDIFISRYTYYAEFGDSRMHFTEIWDRPDDAWWNTFVAEYPSVAPDTPDTAAASNNDSQTVKKTTRDDSDSEDNGTDAFGTEEMSPVLFYATTIKETRVRENANKNSKLITTLQGTGIEVGVVDTVKGKDGKIWYKIRTQDEITGYAREDFFKKTVEKAESGSADDNSEKSGWSEAYKDFVMNKVYAGIGEPDYYIGEFHEPIKFALYDLDNDGIPELFAYNGEGSTAGNSYNVYTYKNNKMKKVGDLGERELFIHYDPAKRYPGLVESEGSMGVYYTEYWYMENNQIKSEMLGQESYYSHGDDEEPDFDNPPVLTQETADSELYNWAMNEAKEDLVTYTYDEISKMGWEEFVK